MISKLYLINGLSNTGNQLRALGEPSKAVGGTADPAYPYSFPIPDCKNPKGKPG